jgi:hypothetical protein
MPGIKGKAEMFLEIPVGMEFRRGVIPSLGLREFTDKFE